MFTDEEIYDILSSLTEEEQLILSEKLSDLRSKREQPLSLPA